MKTIILILALMIRIQNTYAQVHKNVPGNGVILSTNIYSPEKTETVILLHGGPGVPDNMPEVVAVLKNKYRVVTFEQRGTGQSHCNKCSYIIESYIADIDSISNYLHVSSFHLFGHSWGGLYAQIYADARPEKLKSLFLCSPGSGTNKLWKQTQKEVMHYNKSKCSRDVWLKMGWNSLLGKMGSSKAYRKLFRQVLINYHKDYVITTVDESDIAKIYAPPVNKTNKNIMHYKELPVNRNPGFSVIITYGDQDIYGESKNAVYKRYPGAEHVVIVNSGHTPWVHNFEGFSRILKDFYQVN